MSGCLAAWLIKRRVKGVNLRLFERDLTLGGNHTWSFFDTDLTQEEQRTIAPLITSSWPGYKVCFPRHRRQLATGYRSITSHRLNKIIGIDLAQDVSLGADIVSVAPDHVGLASGEKIEAFCVIDAKGAKPTPHLAIGFQKFLGLEVKLAAPHNETIPIIKDASVSQHDGYRFVYTLPFATDRMLIEDTYYSEKASLPIDVLRARIFEYAKRQSWNIASVVREEQGLLPIVLAGDIEAHLAEEAGYAPRIGLAGGFFHPTTGYSLPDAVRVAMLLADHAAANGRPTTASVQAVLNARSRKIWHERRFFRLLNRMMFRAGRPERRYAVLERFYRLDAGLVQRFYAAALTPADRLRIVTGRPPVPFFKALTCVSEARMLQSFRGV